MSNRPLLIQALLVLIMGTVSLLTPPAVSAAPRTSCAAGCGVCYTGGCPSVAVQHSWCGNLCGGGVLSCDDCKEDGPAGCEENESGWWCDAES
jgi:hypothetical protein